MSKVLVENLWRIISLVEHFLLFGKNSTDKDDSTDFKWTEEKIVFATTEWGGLQPSTFLLSSSLKHESGYQRTHGGFFRSSKLKSAKSLWCWKPMFHGYGRSTVVWKKFYGQVGKRCLHFCVPHWMHASCTYRTTDIFKYIIRSNKLDAKIAEWKFMK